MRRAWKWIAAAGLIAVVLAGSSVAKTWAAPQDAAAKPAYTLAEYNAYQAAHAEKDPQAKIKALDDFVSKYPMSALFALRLSRLHYLSYYQLKNYPQTLDYVDKLLALGDKIDLGTRLESLVARAQAYFVGSSEQGSSAEPRRLTGKLSATPRRRRFRLLPSGAKAREYDRRSVRDAEEEHRNPGQFRRGPGEFRPPRDYNGRRDRSAQRCWPSIPPML